MVIDDDSFDLSDGEKYWTPTLFTDTANDYFLANWILSGVNGMKSV
ncbi:MAG TPA: hypothetical protein VEG39_13080 [Clostridia bacterium]|nr:hypothetical protein [Clostridia bacterium]